MQTMARIYRAKAKNYMFRGYIDRKRFAGCCGKILVGVGKAAQASKATRMEHLEQLLGFMENDPEILDIRWMAYILATVLTEAAYAESEPKWYPIDEGSKGKGHLYGENFKVRQVAQGVRLTGERGEQFLAPNDGKWRSTADNSHDPRAAAKAYADDSGTPQVYFGRGYVQLTWWKNYLAAGVLLGRGTDFVMNPELVKDPKISYRIMSISMRTGQTFANNHTFRMYLNDKTDYFNARRMVNGTNVAEHIADRARIFEYALINSATCFQPVG